MEITIFSVSQIEEKKETEGEKQRVIKYKDVFFATQPEGRGPLERIEVKANESGEVPDQAIKAAIAKHVAKITPKSALEGKVLKL